MIIDPLGQYLADWWTGNLTNYHVGSLSIAQVNKVVKSLQYLTGLFGILEIIEFRRVMQGLRGAATIYAVVLRVGTFPLLVLYFTIRLMVGLLLVILLQLSLPTFIKSIPPRFKQEVIEQVRREAEAHPAVQVFVWLANHPPSEHVLRVFLFTAFVVLSLIELLTTTG